MTPNSEERSPRGVLGVPRRTASPSPEEAECIDSEDEDSELDSQSLSRSVAWIKALLFASLPLDDFHLGLTALHPDAGEPSRSFMYRDNISSILNRVAPAAYKVPQLLVSIKTSSARPRSAESGTENVEEAFLHVADPTGEMPAAVHRRVTSLHGANLVSGSVLLLRDVTVFLSDCRMPCLAITHANVVRAFSPEEWTASFQTAFGVERDKEILTQASPEDQRGKEPSVAAGPLGGRVEESSLAGVAGALPAECPPTPRTDRRGETQRTQGTASAVSSATHVKEEMRNLGSVSQGGSSQAPAGLLWNSQNPPVDDTSLLIEDLEGVEDCDAPPRIHERPPNAARTAHSVVSSTHCTSSRAVPVLASSSLRMHAPMPNKTDVAERRLSPVEALEPGLGASAVSFGQNSQASATDGGGGRRSSSGLDGNFGEDPAAVASAGLSGIEMCREAGRGSSVEAVDGKTERGAVERGVCGDASVEQARGHRETGKDTPFCSTEQLDELLDILLEEPERSES
ncbi:hypothetical protein NCLIV_004310 [Neospora caninum Liverpool]|nr:hypothetical protein NCLIV_004310 [Neospora caninum Liverpool]CBZ49947.1 hypothetical protein NCLIV_004310 [Neospora caninum Liverpool]|eukprot:XP_003879982.1 hypothetical protein NCLIV_004310 [Neospora caninum Liverpool]